MPGTHERAIGTTALLCSTPNCKEEIWKLSFARAPFTTHYQPPTAHSKLPSRPLEKSLATACPKTKSFPRSQKIRVIVLSGCTINTQLFTESHQMKFWQCPHLAIVASLSFIGLHAIGAEKSPLDQMLEVCNQK